VPDIYQGCELWDFSLVDPDNRRAVDYVHRRKLLQEMLLRIEGDLPGLLQELLANLEDGRAKLYLVLRLLGLRREHPLLFESGDYLPLTVEGEHAAHVCAFARCAGNDALIVVAPRWFSVLCGEEHRHPVGRPVWGDTCLVLPEALVEREWVSLLDGEAVAGLGRQTIPVAEVLRRFPVGVVMRHQRVAPERTKR
jgi:(1->4)-alpha-D-glucan 1-alpha-D-glucosylmutase